MLFRPGANSQKSQGSLRPLLIIPPIRRRCPLEKPRMPECPLYCWKWRNIRQQAPKIGGGRLMGGESAIYVDDLPVT